MTESATEKRGKAPRYFLADAAILAAVSSPRLRSWVRGTPAGENRESQPPCIDLDAPDSDPTCLSFFNVIEAGFLAAYRRLGVPMQRVRPALEYAKDQLEMPRPLLKENFRVNGRDLFWQYVSEKSGDKRLVNVSSSGQTVWPELVDDYFQSIQYDKHGPILHRLFGPKRPIVGIDPKLSFGQPVIVRNGVRTDVIFDRFHAGESQEDVAKDFSLDTDEVAEAIRWETESLKRAA